MTKLCGHCSHEFEDHDELLGPALPCAHLSGPSYAHKMCDCVRFVEETREQAEARRKRELSAYMHEHRRHNHIPGRNIGVTIGNEDGRQSASCAQCGSSYVGPTYQWIREHAGFPGGVMPLTKFGQLIRDSQAE